MILTTSLYDLSEKILTKRLFPKFQLVPILRLQVMHDYVHWPWLNRLLFEISSRRREFVIIGFILHWNYFFQIAFGEMCYTWRRATKNAKKIQILTFGGSLFWKTTIFIVIFVKIWYFGGHYVLRRYLKMLNAERVSAVDFLKCKPFTKFMCNSRW